MPIQINNEKKIVTKDGKIVTDGSQPCCCGLRQDSLYCKTGIPPLASGQVYGNPNTCSSESYKGCTACDKATKWAALNYQYMFLRPGWYSMATGFDGANYINPYADPPDPAGLGKYAIHIKYYITNTLYNNGPCTWYVSGSCNGSGSVIYNATSIYANNCPVVSLRSSPFIWAKYRRAYYYYVNESTGVKWWTIYYDSFDRDLFLVPGNFSFGSAYPQGIGLHKTENGNFYTSHDWSIWGDQLSNEYKGDFRWSNMIVSTSTGGAGVSCRSTYDMTIDDYINDKGPTPFPPLKNNCVAAKVNFCSECLQPY